jgi:hypothetical protein
MSYARIAACCSTQWESDGSRTRSTRRRPGFFPRVTGPGRIAPTVSLDLTRLSQDELVGLNRRIVEHLRLMCAARQRGEFAEFTVGVRVEFTTDPNRPHT